MGCGDEKLSKYLTQTFIAHCNAMICQQVTLSGDAEWPKVADAVIEARNCCLYLTGVSVTLTGQWPVAAWNARRMSSRNWPGVAPLGREGSWGSTRCRAASDGPSSRRIQRGALASVVSQTSSPLP